LFVSTGTSTNFVSTIVTKSTAGETFAAYARSIDTGARTMRRIRIGVKTGTRRSVARDAVVAVPPAPQRPVCLDSSSAVLAAIDDALAAR
jgi:hypothetical protein